jgi:transposase-like protein
LAIVEEVGIDGLSVSDVARRHDITRQHIYQWRAELRIPMHPAMHSNMKPAGDSDLIPATLLASTGPFR